MKANTVIVELHLKLISSLTHSSFRYEPPVVNPDKLDVTNPENSALFLV